MAQSGWGIGLVTFGALAGAALTASLLDPRGLNRRRAQLRDQASGTAHEFQDFLGKAGRDLSHRTKGVFADVRYRWKGRDVGDDVLVRRVASKMGRYVSHPHAVGITAEDGRVTLTGPILKEEASRVVAAVAATPGVRDVIDDLDIHEDASHVSSLQGGKTRTPLMPDILQKNWSPATRLLVGTAGGALVLGGLARSGLWGNALALAGAPLLVRSITNKELRAVVGATDVKDGITWQKSLEVAAPVESVYAFFQNFVNFPSFMRNIREVINLGEGRSHWQAAGPAGIDVSWDALVTRMEENQRIDWKSEPGSLIDNEGSIRFERVGDDRTRIFIKMSYLPPAGAIGHWVATIFGANPKKEMDEDLLRAKTFLETGKPAHDATLHKAVTLTAQPALG